MLCVIIGNYSIHDAVGLMNLGIAKGPDTIFSCVSLLMRMSTARNTLKPR